MRTEKLREGQHTRTADRRTLAGSNFNSDRENKSRSACIARDPWYKCSSGWAAPKFDSITSASGPLSDSQSSRVTTWGPRTKTPGHYSLWVLEVCRWQGWGLSGTPCWIGSRAKQNSQWRNLEDSWDSSRSPSLYLVSCFDRWSEGFPRTNREGRWTWNEEART